MKRPPSADTTSNLSSENLSFDTQKHPTVAKYLPSTESIASLQNVLLHFGLTGGQNARSLISKNNLKLLRAIHALHHQSKIRKLRTKTFAVIAILI